MWLVYNVYFIRQLYNETNLPASHHHVDQTASVASTTVKQYAHVSPDMLDRHPSADPNVLSALNVRRKRHALTTDVPIPARIPAALELNAIRRTIILFALAHLAILEIHSNNARQFVSKDNHRLWIFYSERLNYLQQFPSTSPSLIVHLPALRHHVDLTPGAKWLVAIQLAPACQTSSEHHQVADPNVSLTKIVVHRRRVFNNDAPIHVSVPAVLRPSVMCSTIFQSAHVTMVTRAMPSFSAHKYQPSLNHQSLVIHVILPHAALMPIATTANAPVLLTTAVIPTRKDAVQNAQPALTATEIVLACAANAQIHVQEHVALLHSARSSTIFRSVPVRPVLLEIHLVTAGLMLPFNTTRSIHVSHHHAEPMLNAVTTTTTQCAHVLQDSSELLRSADQNASSAMSVLQPSLVLTRSVLILAEVHVAPTLVAKSSTIVRFVAATNMRLEIRSEDVGHYQSNH